MSDQPLRLPIESSFNARGTDAAEAALRRLQALQQQKPAGGGPGNYDQQAAAATRAATASQKLATEVQRTAAAENQAAVSAQRLATEEQRTAAATAQAAAAHSRAEQAALRLAAAQDKATQGAAVLPRTIAGLSNEAATAATALLGVGSAMAVISKGAELAQLGAQTSLVRERFNDLALSANTTGDAILGALRKASGGEISDLNLQLAANKSALLGVSTSAEQLGTLMAIARDRAQQMGISTQFAFDSIITGLGRGSALILDNIGITVEAGEVNAAYAASIGKTVAQLSEAEKKQALINAVVAQGNATLAATGGAAESAAGDFAALGAASENAKAAIGELIADLSRVPTQVVTDVIVNVSGGIQQLAQADEQLKATEDRLLEVSGSFDAYGQKLAFVNEQLAPVGAQVGGLTELQFDFAQSLMKSGDSAAEAMAKVREFGTVIQAGAAANTDWGQSSDVLVNQMIALASTSEGNRAAVQNLSQSFLDGNIDAQTLQSALALLASQHEIARQAAAEEAREQRLLSGAHMEVATSAFDAAAASMADTQAKELQTLQTQLLNEQVQIAANAFLDANPSINAAGIQAAVTAGAISPLIGRLAELTLQIRLAKAELGGIAMGRPETGGDALARSLGAASRNQAYLAAQSERAAAAQRDQVLATGTQAQKTAILRSEYDAAVRSFGAGSEQAIRAQTKLLQASRTAAGGGGHARGGGGGAAKAPKVSEAEKTATRLEDIERQGGKRIAEINEQTQEKILAIEAKYAERRAEAQRKLMDEIARSNASTRFDQELNDFDALQKDLTDEQKAALQAREQAEAEYNAKVAQYQQEARDQAANGDAELAEEILAARTEQAKKEKEIAERAAEARQAGAKEADVVRTAQEATEAARQQAETEIAIAHAKAQERAQAQQQEKEDVLDAAEQQRQDVISKAQDSASKIKGASDDQKKTVVDNLAAQAKAAKDWADEIVNQSGRAGDAMAGVTGPPTAPGEGGEGGVGGDAGAGAAPGGQGFAGGGRRSAGGGGGGSVDAAIQTLNDASEIIKVIKPFVAANKGAVKLLNEYSLTVKSAVASLIAIQDLRQRLVAPAPVLDVNQVLALKQDIERVLSLMMNIDASATAKVRVFAKYFETEKSAIDILNSVMELRKSLSMPTPPINPAYVLELIATANAVIALMFSQLIPLKQREIDGLKTYADAAGASVGILRDVADLRKDLSDQGSVSPFDMGLIQGLVRRAAEITRLVQSMLVPLTEAQAEGFQAYADGAGAAIQIISDTAALRKDLSDQKDVSPFDMGLIRGLAMRAKQITQIVLTELLPLTEQQGDAFGRYADAAGGAVSIIKDTAGLRKELAEAGALGLPVAAITALAQDARRITETVVSEMAPMSEETAEAAQRWADTTGAAIETIGSVLDFPSKLFADYRSPTDAQIRLATNDAQRLVDGVANAAAIYDTEGLEAAKLFGEANSAIISAFKDQLLFTQAINSGDFTGLEPARMATFERDTLAILAVADRLGKAAAAVPAGNIAALGNAAGALSSVGDMWLKLAAVPIGNLGQIAGAVGGAGGGTTNNYFTNTFVLPAGTTQQMAKEIMTIMQRQTAARR